MNVTASHIQFQPGGKFYPAALCMFEAASDMGSTGQLHPKIIITLNGKEYFELIRSVSFGLEDRQKARAEAERMIGEALHD